MAGQSVHWRFHRGEDGNQDSRHRQGNGQYNTGANRHKKDTDSVNPAQPRSVIRAVVKADYRGHPHGKAQVQRRKEKLGIEDDGDGRHPLLSQKAEHEKIETEGNHRPRQIAHHFRRTVGAGPQEHTPVPHGAGQPQPPLSKSKKAHAAYSWDQISGRRRQSRPYHPQARRDNQQKVQYGIGQPCRHRQPQAQAGAAGCDKKTLKEELKHIGRCKKKQRTQIGNTIRLCPPCSPQQPADSSRGKKPCQREEYAYP